MRCYKYERGGWGGVAAPPICETSNRMAKRHFLLSLAKICLLRSCTKKASGGLRGGAAPPICKTSNNMITCRFLLSFARFCENMSFPCPALLGLACECGAINMSGGVGRGAAPPICKTSNRMAKRHFLLSLAKICLLRSCPKKTSRGLAERAIVRMTLKGGRPFFRNMILGEPAFQKLKLNQFVSFSVYATT